MRVKPEVYYEEFVFLPDLLCEDEYSFLLLPKLNPIFSRDCGRRMMREKSILSRSLWGRILFQYLILQVRKTLSVPETIGQQCIHSLTLQD